MPVLGPLALEEPDKLHFAAGTGTVAVKPGAIPGRQDSLRVMATVFLAALQVAQAAQHASRASGPQASCHSLQPSTQEEQSSSQPQVALPSAPTQDSTTVSRTYLMTTTKSRLGLA